MLVAISAEVILIWPGQRVSNDSPIERMFGNREQIKTKVYGVLRRGGWGNRSTVDIKSHIC